MNKKTEKLKEQQLEFCVSEDMSLLMLTQTFKDTFPFLRLEVFYNGNPASMLYPLIELKKLTSKRKTTPFTISQKITVEDLIELFWENMGLQISIARNLANSYIETTFTNKWTLQQQNKVGSQVFNEFEM